MATVEKRGKNSYRIRVYNGYDANQKQIVKTKIWKIPEINPLTKKPYTEKASEREAHRQAILFEAEVKNGNIVNGNIKFDDYADRWLKEYAKKAVKARTYYGYEDILKQVRQELGNMRMDRIRPTDLNAYYEKLSEPIEEVYYKCTFDLIGMIKKRDMSQREFIEISGISEYYLRKVKSGGEVGEDTARKISDALGVKLSDIFEKIIKEHVLSDSTIHHHHELLSSMFARAIKWGVIRYNPCEGATPPKRDNTEAECLQKEDIEKLLDSLEDMEKTATPARRFTVMTYKTAIELTLFLGARRGEILGLKWSDINFDNNIISISRSVLYVPEKGTYVDTPKNNTSKRVIRVSENIMDILRRYKKNQDSERMQLGTAWNDNDWVFATRKGNVINPDVISSWFKTVIKEYGLPDVHLHSLRHTNASILISEGIDIQTVASRLGHANATTTAKIYSHAIAEAEARASETLDDVFFDKEKSKN